MQQQVAAVTLRIVLDAGALAGISAERLLGGLPAKTDILEGRRARYPWSDFVAVLEELALSLGGYEALARHWESFCEFAPTGAALFGAFVSPVTLYQFMHRSVQPLLYPMLTTSCAEAADGRLRITHSVHPGYEACPAFGWASYGALRSVPRFMGLGPAHVQALELGPRRWSFLVTPPSASGSALVAPEPALEARVEASFRDLDGERGLTLAHSMLQELAGELELQSARLSAELDQQRRLEQALHGVLTSACNAAFQIGHDQISGANELGRIALAQEGAGLEAALRCALANASSTPEFEVMPLGEPGTYLVIRHGMSAETQRRLQRAASRWQLTPRQTDVLRELIKGGGNHDIARALGCTPRTVEAHVTALLDRADAQSRLSLVAAFWSEEG